MKRTRNVGRERKGTYEFDVQPQRLNKQARRMGPLSLSAVIHTFSLIDSALLPSSPLFLIIAASAARPPVACIAAGTMDGWMLPSGRHRSLNHRSRMGAKQTTKMRANRCRRVIGWEYLGLITFFPQRQSGIVRS